MRGFGVDIPRHEPRRYTLPETLHDVARTQALRRKDITPHVPPVRIGVAVFQ